MEHVGVDIATLCESIFNGDIGWLQQLESPKAVLSEPFTIWRTENCPCNPELGLGQEDSQWFIGSQSTRDRLLTFIKNGRCDEHNSEPPVEEMTLYPLHLAVALGNMDLIVHLISLGVDVNSTTKMEDFSALLYAVATDYEDDEGDDTSIDIVKRLLSVGADISHFTTKGESAIYFAAKKGDEQLVEALLEWDAPVNSSIPSWQSPMVKALKGSYFSIANKLLDAGCSCAGTSPYLSALLHTQEFHLAKCLLKSNECHPNAESRFWGMPPALHTCIISSNDGGDEWKEILQMIIEKGADVNYQDRAIETPLSVAAMHNSVYAMELLLQNGADVNLPDEKGYTAIHFAAWEGSKEAVELLITNGAKKDEHAPDRNTALSLACHGNKHCSIKYLVQLGCYVNNADKDGDTPLLYTTYNGSLESSKVLLDNGADPEQGSNSHVTPLWNAVYSKNISLVLLLLKENVHDNTATRGIDQHSLSEHAAVLFNQPKTPLYVACHLGCEDIVKLLVASGLDLSKETWLHNKADHPEQLANNNNLLTWLNELLNKPRSLLFITRRALRSHLGHNVMKAAPSFPIPTTLTDYLTLNDINFGK